MPNDKGLKAMPIHMVHQPGHHEGWWMVNGQETVFSGVPVP